MHRQIARSHHREPRQQVVMGCRQGVKGEGGIQMVLGVERHVPHQPPQRRQGVGGAGVAQAIGHEGTAAVLGQQHKAQQGLPHRQRQQPIPEQKTVGTDQGNQGQQAISSELQPQRTTHPRGGIGGDVRTGAEISSQPCQMAADLADPPGQAAELQQIGGSGGGGLVLQFRIETHQVGVAVVPLVIAPVEIGVVETQHARPPGHGVVEGAAGEGGAVAGLVHRAEREGQAPTQQQQADQPQRRHQRRRHQRHKHQRRRHQTRLPQRLAPQQPTSHQHAQMEGELQQPGPVMALVESSQPLGRQGSRRCSGR